MTDVRIRVLRGGMVVGELGVEVFDGKQEA